MTQMQRKAKTQKMQNMQKHYKKQVFYKIKKKAEREIFAFFVINFEPIKVQTRSAPQSDHLNFSFVKAFHVVGGKIARMGRKTAIYQ